MKWFAIIGSAGYSLAAAARTILFKRSMGMDLGDNMSPANLYAVVTIMTSAMFLPLAIAMEGAYAFLITLMAPSLPPWIIINGFRNTGLWTAVVESFTQSG